MDAPVLVVVNPASDGGRTAARWPQWCGRLTDLGLRVDTRFTQEPGGTEPIVRKAVQDGATTVLIVGGDGSLSEAVNGYLDNDGRPLNPAAVLALLPSGTGGDTRRTLGISSRIEDTAALLAGGKSRAIDAGRVEFTGASPLPPRHFVNIADCGVGGEVARRVNESSHLGGGTASFLYHALSTLMTYGGVPVRVDVDGDVIAGSAANVIIANGQWFGGGMHIAPDASPDDGLFDVVLVSERSRLRTLTQIRRVYTGSHIGRPGILHRRGKVVTVTPLDDRPMCFDIDGEAVGRAPAVLRCLPGVVRIAAPG